MSGSSNQDRTRLALLQSGGGSPAAGGIAVVRQRLTLADLAGIADPSGAFFVNTPIPADFPVWGFTLFVADTPAGPALANLDYTLSSQTLAGVDYIEAQDLFGATSGQYLLDLNGGEELLTDGGLLSPWHTDRTLLVVLFAGAVDLQDLTAFDVTLSVYFLTAAAR